MKWEDFEKDNNKIKIINNIKKSGIPLEIKTQIEFKKRSEKFQAYPFLWNNKPKSENEDVKNRELDVLAIKTEKIKTDYFDLEFKIHFVCSCKYRKDYSFFLFDDWGNDIWKFPFYIGKKEVIRNLHTSPIKISEIKFPCVSGHQIKCVSNKDICRDDASEKKIDEDQKIVRNASFELVEFIQNRKNIDNFYKTYELQLPWQLDRLIMEDYRKGELNLSQKIYITKKIIENRKILSDNKPYVSVDLYVPIIITEAFVIKTETDSNGEPIDIKNIGWGLSMQRLDILNKFDIFEYYKWAPVILCNINSINECIDSILPYFEQIQKKTLESLKINIYDILASQYLKGFSFEDCNSCKYGQLTKINESSCNSRQLNDFKEGSIFKAKFECPKIILKNEGESGNVEIEFYIESKQYPKIFNWKYKREFKVEKHSTNNFSTTLLIENFQDLKEKLGHEPHIEDFNFCMEINEKGPKCPYCKGTGKIAKKI